MPGPAFYSGTMNLAKNEDWVQSFTYQVDGGAPITLVGSTLRMMIRKTEADHEALVSVASPDAGILLDDAAQGQFTITISRTLAHILSAGDYVADLVRERPDTEVERIFEVAVTVVEGTTR